MMIHLSTPDGPPHQGTAPGDSYVADPRQLTCPQCISLSRSQYGAGPVEPKGVSGGKVALIVAGILAAVAIVMCGAFALTGGDDNKAARIATDTPSRVIAAPEPTEAPALTAADFEATIKVRSKDCIDFQTIPDSCSYTYEVRLGVTDLAAFKRAAEPYSITYAVRGLKGGEQLDTIEIDGDGQFSTWPGFGTAGPKAKITVRIVEVERR